MHKSCSICIDSGVHTDTKFGVILASNHSILTTYRSGFFPAVIHGSAQSIYRVFPIKRLPFNGEWKKQIINYFRDQKFVKNVAPNSRGYDCANLNDVILKYTISKVYLPSPAKRKSETSRDSNLRPAVPKAFTLTVDPRQQLKFGVLNCLFDNSIPKS